MLKATDLPGIPEDLALAIIAYAVTVAPCLDRLPAAEGAGEEEREYRARALATLARIGRAATGRGDALVKGQRIGPAAVDYGNVGTFFSPMDEAGLRGICAALCGPSSTAGTPVGQFPKHGIVSQVWPEKTEI